jgi:cell wall assembly regulator SMI1
MPESKMTRRHAICMAGALLSAACTSDKGDDQLAGNDQSHPPVNTITEAWHRIHDWLSAHAPKILANLNPPATAQEIQEAEQVFALEMPEEWKELYRTHNGMNSEGNLGSLFYGMQFLTLQEAIREFKNNDVPVDNLEPVRAADSGIRREDIFNPKWIAFAHDGGETLLHVDMDPAPTGTAGQVIFTDHADDTVILLNKNLLQFMKQFVDDLAAGRYFLNQEALAEGDEFLDCKPDIDVINWSFSSRWEHLKD